MLSMLLSSSMRNNHSDWTGKWGTVHVQIRLAENEMREREYTDITDPLSKNIYIYFFKEFFWYIHNLFMYLKYIPVRVMIAL